MKKTVHLALAAASLFTATLAAHAAQLSPIEQLGKKMFFDTNLSANGTQSCATCHDPTAGFTGSDSLTNAGGAVYEGAIPRHFGNRKPPTAAYAGNAFLLHQNGQGVWSGGMFWDGRATGVKLQDPLAEQAQGPFLNPLEQSLANARVLCGKVSRSGYTELFAEVWGDGSLECGKDVEGVYEKIGRSIAAYERSAEVNAYSSKFDMFWDKATAAGKDVTKIKCGSGGMMGGVQGCGGGGPNGWASYRNLGMTDTELQGLAVFNDPSRGNCASCHSLKPGPHGYPLFTDFSYSNIGTPRNPDNPFYTMPKSWNADGKKWVDNGLGGYLQSAAYPPEAYEPQLGKFKVPTLRNVDVRPTADFVKAYGHNGFFKSLADIVLFYHWRAMMDMNCSSGGMTGGGMTGGGMTGGGMTGGGMTGGGMTGNCQAMATMFPPPEVDQNRAAMGVFPRPQVDSIVSFLKTLSDGYYVK